jgi:hypothetical protein
MLIVLTWSLCNKVFERVGYRFALFIGDVYNLTSIVTAEPNELNICDDKCLWCKKKLWNWHVFHVTVDYFLYWKLLRARLAHPWANLHVIFHLTLIRWSIYIYIKARKSEELFLGLPTMELLDWVWIHVDSFLSNRSLNYLYCVMKISFI